jgi:DNA-directed RNA polymerase subunit E'/Rpb7
MNQNLTYTSNEQKDEINKDNYSVYIGPYINTVLYASINVSPENMNNNIYINMKNILIKQIKNTCYNEYGYIVDIYKILERRGQEILAENPSASASVHLKFACRLCRPLKNQLITCKIDKINPYIITAINGPIKIIITMEKINTTKFFINIMNKQLYYKNEDNKIKIDTSIFIRVLIKSIKFYNGDKNITALGYLEDIASEEDISKYINDKNNSDIAETNNETLTSTNNFIDFVNYKDQELQK